MARRDLLWLAGALAVAAALHGSVLGAGFTNWDDDRFVTGNPLLAAGGLGYVKAAFTQVQFEAYAPLHLLSYLPDRALWPSWAGGFHLLSLLSFAGALAVWFLLARRLAPAAAAAAAVLAVALHPQTVEPVAWISARKDLLALLFVGLVLLVEDGHQGRRPRALAVVLGLCAYLSKVSAVCLPILVFAHLRWLRGLPARDAAWRALPHAVGALALAIATWAIFREHHMIPPARPDPAVVDVLGTIAAYLTWTVLPRPSPIYPPAAPAAALGAALLAAGLVVAALTWRRWPAPARHALVAFLAAILPVANLVPVVFRFADRYVLLAHAVLIPPLAIGLAAGWRRLAGRRRLRAAAAGALVALLAGEVAVSLPVVGAWQDSRALWSRAAAVHPDLLLVRMKLGETLRDEGEHDAAIAEYQTVIRMAPADYRGYIGLFFGYARRFEAQGKVAPGTADGWYAELAGVMDDAAGYGRLRARVGRAGCAACANTLLLLGLRHWPQPAEALRRLADEARRAGDEAGALIYEDALKRQL